MTQKDSRLRTLCFITLLLSIILFSIAIYLYPGGNPADPNAFSFDFRKNYLCNLYGEFAINHLPNTGRFFALLATAILSLSFALTFYLIPDYLSLKKPIGYQIQTLGAASMVIGFFIFTPFHDQIINISGLFGTVSFFIIFYHLFIQKKYLNLMLGLTAIISSGLTYFIDYSGIFFHTLAIMQKLSILLFVIWMCHTQLVIAPKKNRAPKLENS